jgi:DNA-binding NtrC family response regulator
MSKPRILLVDHPTPSVRHLEQVLEEAGFDVLRTAEQAEALALLLEGELAVILGELGLAGGAILDEARRQEEPPPVVLFDDFCGVEQAADATLRGAFGTLSRPVSEEQVLLTVRRALEQGELRRENLELRRRVGERFELGGLVSSDPRMREIFQTLEAVADSRVNLLIQGESGTGKTVLAQGVHQRSSRAERPFVLVNCGALPSALLESELFGHVRGAFTGAVRSRQGKFEAAHGGTIFLDEIATAPPELQVKLLRMIEEGSFERVGESETQRVDVRVIAASNRELRQEVEAGRFRADLYYRLDVVSVHVPPLRERTGDIPLLARIFLERFCLEHQRELRGIEPPAMSELCAHDWPGNVRELENTLERAVLLARGPMIRIRDLWPDRAEPGEASTAEPGTLDWSELPFGPLKEALEVPERWLILRALRHHRGNRQQTARTLGINRTTLFNKMRKYNLTSFPTRVEDPAEPPPPPFDRAG